MTEQMIAKKTPVLKVEYLNFKRGKNKDILNDISFDLYQDKTLSIVGETGAGKSTLARIICNLITPTSGKIYLNETEISRKTRTQIQMVFQDPFSSLNPKRKVINIVSEPLRYIKKFRKKESRKRAADLLKEVGIAPEFYDKYPTELSGGQCQRVAVARALAADPVVLICDEAVSSLDVSVQAQVLNLLDELKKKMGFSLIFITHDLKVAKIMSDEVLVLYKGNIMEYGPADRFFHSPLHPYSKQLLMISKDPLSQGDVVIFERPNAGGCPYKDRCSYYKDECDTKPVLSATGDSKVACFFPLINEDN
jgi:oligopeptide/dipeptide ABC transporter ATP-binding protein